MTHVLPAEGIDLRFPMDTGCVGCSPTNPIGMHLVFRREGDAITGRYTAPPHFRGGPGAVHGGILALLLDEYSCAAGFFLTGNVCVTGSFELRYERPAHIGDELRMEARIVDRSHPRYLIIEATVQHAGVILVRSAGRFFPIDPPSDVSSPA
ncbi:MAG: PaaI family thioesterase [Polyangiales bacterium]|nr:PaaI family thioesterase [Myxococcales bacterium]MCB9660614.1 PaaI family thioesterase [Sandaracinaceae bacterium]